MIRVGALTTHAELGASDLIRQHVPLLAEAVPLIAHPAIRNRGTIGGSLAFADPAAELPACCVALEAHDRRAQRRKASGASRRRSSSPASMRPRSRTSELIAAVEFPAHKPGGAQRDPRAGAALGRLCHGRHRGAGRRSPAARWSTRSLVFFGVGDRPVSAERRDGGARRQARHRPRRSPRRRPRSMPISTRPPTSTAAPR